VVTGLVILWVPELGTVIIRTYSSRDPAGAVHLIVAVVVVTGDAETVALLTGAGSGRK
jgi:hypothetical protein